MTNHTKIMIYVLLRFGDNCIDCIVYIHNTSACSYPTNIDYHAIMHVQHILESFHQLNNSIQ